MQTVNVRRAALPMKLPAFFHMPERPKAPAKPEKIVPQNGKTYRIQFSTPTGRYREGIAKFLTVEKNAIISDRWIVRGRSGYVVRNHSVKVISLAR